MSSAAVFLIVAAGAALIGSLVLVAVHRVRRPAPLEFHDQLRALAPRNSTRPPDQPSGIVPLTPGDDEER
ncbi:MAG: hypothetical protein R2695_21400 [Acidimicrobiales bacterium]